MFTSMPHLKRIGLKTAIFSLFTFLSIYGFSDPQPSNADHTAGKRLFEAHCAGCHNFRTKGMGPALGGLGGQVDKDWMMSFVSDPKKMIDQGDDRAVAQFNIFHTYMPSYGHLPKDSLEKIVDYILSVPAPRVRSIPEGALANPIAELIPMSALTVEIEPFMQFPQTNEITPFTRIVKMESIPGTDLSFVADLQGQIYPMTPQGPSLFFDMNELFPNFITQPGLGTGLGSFTYHPDFLTNGLLYTTHAESVQGIEVDFSYSDTIPITLQWIVNEWKLSKPTDSLFKANSRELLRIDIVGHMHGMQDISFNASSKKEDSDYGLLYVCIGDGGSVEKGFPFLTMDEDKIWGSVLRIDPLGKNSSNGKYGIPTINPFQDEGQAKEVFAKGFRNPHRLHWLQDGRLLVSNIGHLNVESLYLVEAGDHCGWPFREGHFKIQHDKNLAFIYKNDENDERVFNYPVAQFDHDEGNAIIGGYEYLGQRVPEMKGKYLFGDIVRGRLFYLNTSEIQRNKISQIYEWQVSRNGNVTSLIELTKATRTDLRFGRDGKGEIILMTKPDGMMYTVGR